MVLGKRGGKGAVDFAGRYACAKVVGRPCRGKSGMLLGKADGEVNSKVHKLGQSARLVVLVKFLVFVLVVITKERNTLAVLAIVFGITIFTANF